MSPQRKKGRGGGGGKTLAPLPSRVEDERFSPPLLPCKIIKERRALRHSLSAAKKSSINLKASQLDSAARKLNQRGKPESSSALNVSSSDPLTVVVNSASNSSSGRLDSLVHSYLLDSSACRKSSPKSVKCLESEKRARTVSAKSSAVGLSRIRRSAKEEGSKTIKDTGKANVSVAANWSGKEASGSSRNLPRETGSESLRWSTTALLSQNGKGIAVAKRIGEEEARVEVGVVGALQQDASQTSEDERCFRGLAVSTASASKSCVAKEPCDVERDGTFSASAKSTIRQTCSDVVPAFGLRQEREASMQATDNVQAISDNKNSDGPQAQAVAVPGKQNGISNFSSALHRRLALLEGKVSQIAAELKKTKEMLDSNYPRGSIVLSDIKGKISSIERAMTSRLSDLEAVPPDDDIMEDQSRPSSCSWSYPLAAECVSPKLEVVSVSIATPKDPQVIWDATTSCSGLASGQDTVSNQLPLDGPASALPTPARLTSDQQELEDRLFPHRKLLKSRLSLHDRVVESRAVLHSKLGDALPEIEIEGLELHLHNSGDERSLPVELKLPCTGHEETLEMKPFLRRTAETQPCGSCSVENEKAGKAGIPDIQVPKPSMVSMQEPSQLHNAGPTCPDTKLSNANALHCPSVIEADSSRLASCSEKNRAQGSGSTEDAHLYLECDESLPINDAFENQENSFPADAAEEEYDDFLTDQLYPIGERIATAGWYVCEGEAIVLAQDDGCCSYYDVANMEEKAEYKAPEGIANSVWNDCWLIRAAGSDGRSNKYIVAASAGCTLDCGFCAWDFYSKDLVAYHSEYQTMSPTSNASAQSSLIHSPSLRNRLSSSLPLMSLPLSDSRGSKTLGVSRASLAGVGISATPCHLDNSTLSYQNEIYDSPQWWYRPCGPLMASAASSLRSVVLHDIRDSEIVMTWNTKQPIMNLDYGSPLQWRNKDKLALAEEDAISIWDVNSMDSQCLQYIQLSEKRVSAFQIQNADAECSGGVRQRMSSSKAEGYDGICCTQSDINIIDLRVPKGLGTQFPVSGLLVQSVFAQGDMILTGSLNNASGECGVQQWSVRKGKPVCAFAFPASNCHYTHLSLTQVWGSLDTVMAVNGNGLYIFKGGKEGAEDGTCITEDVNDVIGTQDLFNPSFDYANFRVLLISRDRPASWCYWP